MSYPASALSFLRIYPGTPPRSHARDPGEDKHLGHIPRSQAITLRTSGLTSYRGGAVFIDSFACECVWLKRQTMIFKAPAFA